MLNKLWPTNELWFPSVEKYFLRVVYKKFSITKGIRNHQAAGVSFEKPVLKSLTLFLSKNIMHV